MLYPKRPNKTDGIPEAHSVQKRKTSYDRLFLQMNTAHTVKSVAPKDAHTAATAPDNREPTMAGKIPPAVPNGVPEGKSRIKDGLKYASPSAKMYKKTKNVTPTVSNPHIQI